MAVKKKAKPVKGKWKQVPAKKNAKKKPARKNRVPERNLHTVDIASDRQVEAAIVFSEAIARKEIHPYSAMGKPRIYTSRSELLAEVDGFFEWIKGEYEDTPVMVYNPKTRKREKAGSERRWIREPEPATLTGLILYLGFTCRQSFERYEKDHLEFADIIRVAKLRVQSVYERNLHGQAVTGSIFALKAMFGLRDRSSMQELIDESEGAIKGFVYEAPVDPRKNTGTDK